LNKHIMLFAACIAIKIKTIHKIQNVFFLKQLYIKLHLSIY
jgi:hypothetical protein